MYHRYGTSSKQSSFRSAFPLSNDQILQHAPSVMAAEAHESRGERYAFVPTLAVIDGLRAEGFQPYEVRQTRCRDLDKREHTKHLVRLRHPDAQALTFGGAEVPEIVLVNSHDGTSSYQLLSGIFRMVCSNGMIAGDICDDVRIRHSGNIVEEVIEGSFRVLDNLKLVGEHIDQYKAIEVSRPEQLLLANAAAEIRWGSDDAGNRLAPLHTNDQLLNVHRYDDRNNDLWTTFNRIQENVIQGGLGGRSASGRRTRTRAVAGVNENVRLNKALWTLANQFAKLKLAA